VIPNPIWIVTTETLVRRRILFLAVLLLAPLSTLTSGLMGRKKE